MDGAAVHAAEFIPGKHFSAFHVLQDPVNIPDSSRRFLFSQAKRLFEVSDEAAASPHDLPPRLTTKALEALRMSRSRDRILTNLEEMYREAFDRARASDDAGQMAQLDFAYRREQLYFEILLDVRDAMERKQG